MLLQNKKALVTGGCSGIGLAIVQEFVQQGAFVYVLDKAPLAPELAPLAAHVQYHAVDITQESAAIAAVQAVLAHAGTLHILVNNAGIDGEQQAPDATTNDNWNNVLAVNLHGVLFVSRPVMAHFKQTQQGNVVNIASIAGMVGFANLTSYAASKGALIQLTRAWAIDLAAEGIRVNAVCPSVVQTPLVEHFINTSADPAAMRAGFQAFNPLPGMVTPQAVAKCVRFLASADSDFVSGVALPVDGAYTAR